MTRINIDKIIRNKFRIRDKTLPFMGRHTYTRNDLIKLFGFLEFKNGAEIGVLDGSFSEYMINNIPGLKLIGVDIWMDYAGRIGSNIFNIAQKKIGDKARLLRMNSYEAAKLIPDNSLDFVYIDADHSFDGFMIDLITWSKKVKVGGIVSGHDYHINVNYGVVSAVESYTKAHNIHNYYITHEEKPSWFWVKHA